MKTKKMIIISFLFIFLSSLLPPVSAETASSEVRDSFNPAALVNLSADAQRIASETLVTLDLKGVDVLDVLKILGERSGLNIVAGKDVRGNVTLYVKNVPIRDALNTITSALNLTYIQEGSIINVMSSQAFQSTYGISAENGFVTRVIHIEHTSQDEATKIVEQLKTPRGKITFDPRTRALIVSDRIESVDEIEKTIREIDQAFETRVFKVQFADVSVLSAELQEHMTENVGIMNVDERTNQISITDRPQILDQIAKVVEAFDVAPRQVLIEAKLVEVTLYDTYRAGIDWEYVRQNLNAEAFDNIGIRPAFNLASPAATLGGTELSTFTFTGGVAGMKTILSLLQNVGRTNTLSTPRVAVLNNEEAKLVDATKQPYISQTVVQSLNSAQTSDNVQFVDVGVTLTVVPTIADDEKLVLRLKPEVSTQTGSLDVESVSDGSNTAFTRSSIPIVASQSLETTVLVKSGETLVVGGLIKDSQIKSRGRLPVFSDVPLLGRIFQSEAVDFVKTELVIFLTPHIIHPGDGTVIQYDQPLNPNLGEPTAKLHGVVVGDAGSVVEQQAEPTIDVRRPYWDKTDAGSSLQVQEYYSLVKEYKDLLAREVRKCLQQKGLLKDGVITASLFIQLRSDGTLLNAAFLNPEEVRSAEKREKILQAIQEQGNFPPFPSGLSAPEDSFYIRL